MKRSHCTWWATITAQMGLLHWPRILCFITLYGKPRREERQTAQDSKSDIKEWLHLGGREQEEEEGEGEDDKTEVIEKKTTCISSNIFTH